MKEKVGLVLGGGGGKGAYQIGVWRALREAAIDTRIDTVAGTSIGALNGALFCMGNLETAEQVWASISPTQVLTEKDIHKCCQSLCRYEQGTCSEGWFSNAGLDALIKRVVDPRILKNGTRNFYVTAAKLKKRPCFYNYVKKHSEDNIFTRVASLLAIKLFKYQTTPVYFDIRRQKTALIADILLASSAIPLIFPDISIEGEEYIDGGIEDNVPIAPLYQRGVRKMIVVTMEERDKTCTQCFPDAQIVHINLAESTLQNFTGTLDFTAENAKKRMDQGYWDGKKYIASIQEMLCVSAAKTDFQ